MIGCDGGWFGYSRADRRFFIPIGIDMTGYIKSLHESKYFGFIRCPDEVDRFFHVSDLADGLEWGPLLQEMRVEFQEFDTEKGPRATNVRAAD